MNQIIIIYSCKECKRKGQHGNMSIQYSKIGTIHVCDNCSRTITIVDENYPKEQKVIPSNYNEWERLI